MPLDRDEEIRLVQQVQQNPSEQNLAFQRLWEEYGRRLYGYIRVRSRSDDDADDIASETWFRFWRSLPGYRAGQTPVLPFLRVLALRAIVDYYRRKKKSVWGHMALEELGEQLDRLPQLAQTMPETSGSERAVLDADTIRRIWWIIFNDQGAPHQVIAYIYRAVINLKPQEIMMLDKMSLSDILEKHLKQELLKKNALLSKAEVDKLLDSLNDRLTSPLEKIVTDANTREALGQAMLTRIAGATKLSDYYKGDPSTNISQWCQTVNRRVVKAAINAGIGRNQEEHERPQ